MASFHSTKVAEAVCAKNGHRIKTSPIDKPPIIPLPQQKTDIVLPAMQTYCERCGMSIESIRGRLGKRAKK